MASSTFDSVAGGVKDLDVERGQETQEKSGEDGGFLSRATSTFGGFFSRESSTCKSATGDGNENTANIQNVDDVNGPHLEPGGGDGGALTWSRAMTMARALAWSRAMAMARALSWSRATTTARALTWTHGAGR